MLDLNHALEVAVGAAQEASVGILQGYHEPLDIQVKSDPVDRVTQFDLAAQELIVDAITAQWPDHGFLGEEDLTRESDSPYRWVIDPIDGTSNYIQRLPHVGTSIALEHDGQSVLGVIHFPVYGDTYAAVRGQGATRNGQPIAVSPCEQLSQAVIAEIFSDRTHRGQDVIFPPGLAYRKFGSAVTSLAYLAEGRIHATALRCSRWDIAAAEVLVTEAGGSFAWWYDDPGDERRPLTVIASSPGIHEPFTEFVKAEYAKTPLQENLP